MISFKKFDRIMISAGKSTQIMIPGVEKAPGLVQPLEAGKLGKTHRIQKRYDFDTSPRDGKSIKNVYTEYVLVGLRPLRGRKPTQIVLCVYMFDTFPIPGRSVEMIPFPTPGRHVEIKPFLSSCVSFRVSPLPRAVPGLGPSQG